jgi:HD-GYP domain-containing protein (c-di-GMP phosphodiesterase class II)
MPVLIPCHELQPGMRLADPIRRAGRTLLAGGKQLTRAEIDSLQARFPDMTVAVADPILEDIVEFEDVSREFKVAETVIKKIAGAMSEVQKRFSARASLSHVHFAKLHRAVKEVLRYLDENPVSAGILIRTLDGSPYLARHAGNVFYLSMLLGSTVREYVLRERMRDINARDVSLQSMLDLTPLGLGAVFMDIGMLPLQDLYEQDRTLTPEERQQLHGHPDAGADMLPASTSVLARAIVKTHHENFDGSGYPRRIPGHRLHVFTRVVRITDAFDAATSAHVYKKAKSPARALWEIAEGAYRRFYDPVLTRMFARLIQPFPIGAKLRLTDGRYAVVTRYNRANPFQPHVIIAFDRDNRRLPSAKLDGPFGLHERPNLHIASFGGEDLSYIYESKLDQPDAFRPKEFMTLFEAVYP